MQPTHLLVFWYQHLLTTAIHSPRQRQIKCTTVRTHVNSSRCLNEEKKKRVKTGKTFISSPTGDRSHLSAWNCTEIYLPFIEQRHH